MSTACGGEETESVPQTTETPASAPEEVLAVADARDLPTVGCDERVEAVRTFVETDDHRAFGYVSGCLGAPPRTFERCLYYFTYERGVHRRCGQGEAPVAEEAATEEAEEVGMTEAATATP
jgi:hypothetical protein